MLVMLVKLKIFIKNSKIPFNLVKYVSRESELHLLMFLNRFKATKLLVAAKLS